jgi:hypothetical protein
MSKRFEDNEDWIKREQGRVPTKGAMAAERASAGLGTSEDDARLLGEFRPIADRIGQATSEKPAGVSPLRSDQG